MTITVKIDGADEIRKKLSEAAGKMADLSPILKAIGDRAVEQTKQRFEAGGPAPDGTPWKAPKYSNEKRIRTLTVSGHLRDSIRSQVFGKNRVEIGTNKIYGAIHQFGGPASAKDIYPSRKKALKTPFGLFKKVHMPAGAIPARPFLGFSRENSDEIIGIINDWITEGMS